MHKYFSILGSSQKIATTHPKILPPKKEIKRNRSLSFFKGLGENDNVNSCLGDISFKWLKC